MDPKHTDNPEILELIRRSSASRNHLSADITILRQRLDVPNRVRLSLKENPTKWLIGSIASGFVMSILLKGRRKKKEKKPRSFALKVAALTLTAARPLAKVWITDQLKRWATNAYQARNSPFTIEPSQPNVQPSGPRPR